MCGLDISKLNISGWLRPIVCGQNIISDFPENVIILLQQIDRLHAVKTCAPPVFKLKLTNETIKIQMENEWKNSESNFMCLEAAASGKIIFSQRNNNRFSRVIFDTLPRYSTIVQDIRKNCKQKKVEEQEYKVVEARAA